MSRWISVARPSTFPRELSRCFRWRVEYGSMEYSAVTQPPRTCCSFIQRGTASSIMAEQITRVSPVLTSTEAARAARDAFAMAGLGPRDIGVAQLYDCFTITVLMTLEDYGFCEKGEAARFVADGNIEIGGGLPINTSGGLLSETGMPGLQLVIEGVRQMRGDAVTQVRGADTCLVTNQGGTMHTHAALILGSH